MKTVGYVRVSTVDQSTQLQRDALDKWAAHADVDLKVYSDKFTGRTMNRPGWNDLWFAVESGEVERIVVWKLDRLGRTALELLQLFNYLIENNISLVSITDGLDLGTPNGRLMARMLAAFAEFDNEIRKERQLAGIEAKRDPLTGQLPWKSGRKQGYTKRDWKQAVRLREKGLTYPEVAQAMGVSVSTIKNYLQKAKLEAAV